MENEMITYKAPGMEIKMEKQIAYDFIERLVDEHLYSNPIEDWIFAWGVELGILKENEDDR